MITIPAKRVDDVIVPTQRLPDHIGEGMDFFVVIKERGNGKISMQKKHSRKDFAGKGAGKMSDKSDKQVVLDAAKQKYG